MKKIKRIIATCLCVSLSAGFAACKSEKDGDNGELSLIWYNLGTKQSDTELVVDEFNKRVKEKLGFTVDFQLIDLGTYADKMNMIISSNEEYDLCFTSSWSNDFWKNAKNGAYYPLDELLKETPALYEFIPDFAWEDARVNGEIMAVPNYQAYTYYEAVAVPKRLAEKYNLDVNSVKTLTDLEPYLQQIKENEPELYPLKPNNFNTFTLKYFQTGAPGVSIINEDADGKVYSFYETPEYKQRLTLMRDYYKKGYIRPDVVSADEEESTGVVKYGAWRIQAGPGSAAQLLQQYGEEIIEIPLVDEVFFSGGARATMTAIGANSKHPKEALKLIELMNTDKDLYNLIYFGIEGKHYNKITDKTVRIVDDGGYVNGNGFAFGSQFNSYYIEGQPENLWEEADALNRSTKPAFLLGFTLDTDNIKNEISNISATEKEYEYIELGAEDYEKIYEEFISKLYSAGLEKVMDEVQRQINEFIAEK
ncbi:MAG: extracellular solute-binding protein [Clostridia bacterium]|nr:extracellular solute-binding protein [Clostridia bacterium]